MVGCVSSPTSAMVHFQADQPGQACMKIRGDERIVRELKS
jgi:hypothetical protein